MTGSPKIQTYATFQITKKLKFKEIFDRTDHFKLW